MPLAKFGFVLNKDKIRCDLILRHGRPLNGLPAMCPCGQKYNLTNALNFKKGGFATRCHNDLREFEADMLSKIVNDVEPVTDKIIKVLSGNASRLDIRARGVWGAGQNTIFDVRVTNTHSPLQIPLTTESV